MSQLEQLVNPYSIEDEDYKSFKPEHNIKFLFFCKLLEKIIKLKPKDKFKLIHKFLNAYFKDYSTQHISLYPLFRLLFPKLDRERPSYGIQEVFIGQLYTNILSLPDQEKLMIKHWKNPNFVTQGYPVGDFVNLIYYILQKRVTEESQMTVNDINGLLNELSVAKNKDERTVTMTKIIKNCSALEQKWIVSIILKDLKVGMSHEPFFKVLEPRALDVFNSTSSLYEVTMFLMNPQSEKYANCFFQLFQPIKPMLVARLKLQEIMVQFTGVAVYIENKFDGERIQCHLSNNEVKFFSRNSIDYTYLYGPKMSHLIKTCVNAKSVILDGEMVVWDKIDNKYVPFGENKAVAGDLNEVDKVIVYEIFDVIYLVPPNGEPFSLQNVILSDRKTILNKIITPIPKKLEIVDFKETTSIDEVMKYFTEAVNRGEEGIIIKKKDSIYKPDDRCVDWVKMKSDYIDNIVDTFDLVIIGGYYGEGKRVGLVNEDNVQSVNSFLVGVVKTLNIESPRNSIILPLVKVGSGYSMEQLTSLRRKLNSKWKKYDSRMPPPIFGVWTPAVNERPDVYLEDPSESIILELKGAEVTASESFPTRVTLRFPRVVSVRTDKPWNEAMKYSELLQFYDNSTSTQHNHLIKNKRGITDLMSDEVKLDIDKDKKRKKVDKYSKILENFRDTDTTGICKLTNLFQGFQFLVLSLDDIMSINSSKKKALEYAIVEHGGEKVQNYLPTTTHVIAEKINLKIKNILNLNDINIINSKWVYDCIKNQKILKLSPIYLTSINTETREEFSVTIDKYNDNYYEDVDEDSLREIFNSIDVKEANRDWPKCFKELRKEFGGSDWLQQYIVAYK